MNIVDRLPLQWNCLGLNFRFGWAVAHRNVSFLAGCAFGGLGDIKMMLLCDLEIITIVKT